jgi:hypothetical protein
MYTRKAHATREAPMRDQDDQPDTREGQAGRAGVAERFAMCAGQRSGQKDWSPSGARMRSALSKGGVMPRRPEREAGMEKPKRARRRKPETAKAHPEPPLEKLWRTGCLPRGGIRRVCGEVLGHSRWGPPQKRTGRPKVGQGRARTMGAKAFSFTHRTKVFADGTLRKSVGRRKKLHRSAT